MPPTFHAKDFIARLGKNLIKEFEDARQATTGPLIGTAIETPVRRRLEQVLPRGIAVGSGCVVDSYGNCSKQQDVVLYERDVCPVFSVNDTPESTYYPCEGVLGVIEVKSSLDTASLRDSFEKTESVRRLRRHGIYGPPSMRGESRPNYRRYESTKMANRITFADPEQLNRNGLDQIFGAVLSGSLRISPSAFCARFAELAQDFGDDSTPNIVEVLDGGTLLPCSLEGNDAQILPSAKNATHFMYLESDPLRMLIHSIYLTYREGVTSPTDAFDRYVVGDETGYSGRVFPKAGIRGES